MKRVLNVILVLSLLAAMAVPALARNVDFVPSISDKGAPGVVGSGEIKDTNGNSVGTADNTVVIITPVSEAKTSDKISDADEKNLLDAYDKLTSGDKAYGLCPGLEDLADKLYDGVKEEDLVVRDLFDVSLNNAELEGKVGNGNTITLKLDANVAKGDKVLAMVKDGDTWTAAVNVVNNGDGTVSVTLNTLGAVVLMTATASGSSVTGDTTQVAFWGIAVVLSLGAIVTMVSLKRRKVTE